jgi:ABC-type Fe3+-hydroxamate transport system substrate-binding protein
MRRFAVSVYFLTACSSPVAVSGARAPSETCRERVVSLHDVTTEAVLRYGAQKCLVGVSEPTDLAAELHSQLNGIRRVESTESVLAVQPTQVLALAIVAEHQPELFRELERRKIGWIAPRLERVTDVHALAADVGKRVDREPASREYTQRLAAYAAPIGSVRNDASIPVPQRLRVFIFDCCAPPYTAGKRAVITDVLAQAGADNVFADIDDDWFNASWEAAIQRKPDLVLIDDYGGPGNLEKKRDALRRITPLADLPVVVLPLRDALGTIRSADVIQQLKAAIARSFG